MASQNKVGLRQCPVIHPADICRTPGLSGMVIGFISAVRNNIDAVESSPMPRMDCRVIAGQGKQIFDAIDEAVPYIIRREPHSSYGMPAANGVLLLCQNISFWCCQGAAQATTSHIDTEQYVFHQVLPLPTDFEQA